MTEADWEEPVPTASGTTTRKDNVQPPADKGIAAQRLKSFVERIERLEEEKKALGADIREVYNEAGSSGYNVKIIRQVIKLRKMDTADRQEEESLLAVYLDAIGELASTPLGQAAAPKA
jgi:uncharacterized protein (UPF0335 family)